MVDTHVSLDPDRESSPLKISFVTETYLPEINGVALTLSRWATMLGKKGHQVSLVRPRIENFHASEELPTTWVNGLPIPGYDGLRFGLPAGRLIRRAWKQERPDIVYIATEGPLGASALRCARKMKIPTLTGFHTNFHVYSRHYGFGLLYQLILSHLRRFHNRSQGTVVPTVEMAESLRESGFRNVNVLGRGVESGLFSPDRRSRELRNRWGIEDDDLAVLYVGRLAPEKNLPLAINAYTAMRGVSARIKFVVVGDGPMLTSFRKQYPDIRFCDLKTGVELAEHYASCDLFLFPSESETFGNVTLEAMSSGLAVIAYDYAAARMHINDGQTGVLVPFGEPESFISASTRSSAFSTRRPALRMPSISAEFLR